MSTTIHLKGFLEANSDGIRFKGEYESIADSIASKMPSDEYSKHQPEDNYQTSTSVYEPKVFLRMHMSDNEMTLEQAINKQILATIGELDVYSEWYGYSEYTIEGYSVCNFTVGNHDIEKILESYIGKYAHIVVEVDPARIS